MLAINAESSPGVARLDQTEFDRLLALPNAHLVAESSCETVIGYALAFPDFVEYDGEEFQKLLKTLNKPFLYIDQIAIRANKRRTGVASALYKGIEMHARSRSMSALCCEVNLRPPNPTSIKFHRRMGFEEFGRMETKDQRTVLLMRMPLIHGHELSLHGDST